VPVMEGDADTFIQVVRSFCKWLDLVPRFVGSSLEVKKIEPSLVSPTGQWALYPDLKGNNQVLARTGAVTYKVDLNKIPDVSDENRRLLNQLGLVLTFKLGDVMTTISREELEYRKNTIAKVKEAIDAFLTEGAAAFGNELTSCATLWEARCKFYEMSQDYNGRNLHTLFGDKWFYNGVPLKQKGQLVLKSDENELAIFRGNDIYYFHGRTKKRQKEGLYAGYGNSIDLEDDPRDYVFLINDLDPDVKIGDVLLHNFSSRVGKHAHDGTVSSIWNKEFIVLRCKKLTADEILQQLGNPPAMKMSELEIPEETEEQREKRDRKPTKIKYVEPAQFTYWRETDAILADGGIYVSIFGNSTEIRGDKYFDYLQNLINLKIAPAKVLGVPASVRKPERLEKIDTLVKFEVVAKKAFDDYMAAFDINLLTERYVLENLEEKPASFGELEQLSYRANHLAQLPDKHPVRVWCERYKLIKTVRYHDIRTLDRVMCDGAHMKKVERRKPKYHLGKALEKINARWPMLKHLNDYTEAWRAGWDDTLHYLTSR
jgi:hypothetical protein